MIETLSIAQSRISASEVDVHRKECDIANLQYLINWYEGLPPAGGERDPRPGEMVTDVELFAAMGDRVERVCELCDDTEPVRRYAVRPHPFSPGSALLMTGFGACGPCAALVEAGRWQEILARWAEGSPQWRLVDGYRRNLVGVAG